MLDWLREKRQTPRAIERFWRQVLVSAINEELDRMAAAHGFQVFWLGMLARADSYEMGVPAVPLRELYDRALACAASAISGCTSRAPVTAIETADRMRHRDRSRPASAAPPTTTSPACPSSACEPLLPDLPIDWTSFEHSPITGIHLWFDRPITDLPHATLLDRTIQWMFNKSDGRYIQLVVSASRSLAEMPRTEVIDLAVRELAEFFPAVQEAKLERAHVVKEVRATFSATARARSPPARRRALRFENFFLAGDWTRSGWPATMEGAVRSGYLAAEAVTAAAGKPQNASCCPISHNEAMRMLSDRTALASFLFLLFTAC